MPGVLMRMRWTFTLCAALAMFTVAGGMPAAAQVKGIAVVDVKRVLSQSLAARDIRKQLQGMTQGLAKRFDKMRQEFRQEEKDLATKRAILAPERFSQLRRELARKAQQRQRELNVKRVAIDRSAAEAMSKVENVFRGIAAEIVEQKKLMMVLRKASIIHAPSTMDITGEVLKKLDRRLPAVKVAKPVAKP